MERDLFGKSLVVAALLGLWTISLALPRLYAADIELTLRKQLRLEASPLDISTSADGGLIFILTPGEILVYSASEDQVVKRITVDKAFDRLKYSPIGGTLVLASGPEKALKIVHLEFVHRIDLSGHAFKGPEKAPVTVVVFGDYQ